MKIKRRLVFEIKRRKRKFENETRFFLCVYFTRKNYFLLLIILCEIFFFIREGKCSDFLH